jgi:predicted methyltransferase
VGRKKGKHIDEEVRRRLAKCGWKIIKKWERGQGIVARWEDVF